MRIAHVITRLILGGAQENTLYTVIGQHRNPAFDVTLVIGVDDGTEGTLVDRARSAGVSIVVMPRLVRPIRPLTDLVAFLDLYRFFRRSRFDIVHTHSSKAGILGRPAARLAGVPIVVHTLHSLVFHEYQSRWKNGIYIALKRACAPMTDILISVSDKTTQGALAARVGRPEQYITIYSGFDLGRFLNIRDELSVPEAKRRLGIPADAPVVGKVARLFPFKGHDHFMQAAADLARRDPRVWFLLVGDGPLRPTLEAQARNMGIADRVVFAGRVAPDEVPALMQAMDVVVHTSVREGIARVLPQAGAVAKPVVTFDLDGAPEVVKDGVSGYLVPPLDTGALVERVLDLIADPRRCAAFGEAGRSFAVRHFSVDLMVDRINDVYWQLLGRNLALATTRT